MTSFFCHLEGGRGGVSNDRVVAGEGQETIQLNDKDIREQLSRQTKVLGEIRNILLREMKKKMKNLYLP